MGKRLNVAQLVQKKYTLVQGLSQELINSIGNIEDTFTAIIYGQSGNGKTNFLATLLKELKPVGDMLYISYEEAHGKTIQDLILRHNLHEELPNLRFSDGETIDELIGLLKKKRSPKLIVIDSWQFSGLTLDDYKKIKKEFVFGKSLGKRKIIIIISHVVGSLPDGKAAQDIKKDCNIKIHVKGFLGIVDASRYGSIKNFVIWEHGAKNYWGTKKFKKLTDLKTPKTKTEKPKQPTPKKVTHMQIMHEATNLEKSKMIFKNDSTTTPNSINDATNRN